MITASTEVTITPTLGAGRELARSTETREWVLKEVTRISQDLKSIAPVRTGAGRRSIQPSAQMGAEGWYGVASWDPAHYYMGILNSREHWADPVARGLARYI